MEETPSLEQQAAIAKAEARAKLAKEKADRMKLFAESKARRIAEDAEAKRLFSIAITEAQTAQMWAVKAITWK